MEQLFIDFAEAISPALQTLLEALFALLAAQASAWMYKQYQVQRARLTSEQQYIVDFVVSQAIRAAEQMYKDKRGDEKKAYAIAIVEKELSARGLIIDIDPLEAKIEAAVFSHFAKPPITIPFDAPPVG